MNRKDFQVLHTYFFNVHVSAYVWKKLLQWLHISRDPMQWDDELSWAERMAKGRNPTTRVDKMMLARAV